MCATRLPGARAILYVLPSNRAVTSGEVATLINGEYIYYVYGEIGYSDVFEQPHKTTFCVFLAKDLQHLSPCGKYNEAD